MLIDREGLRIQKLNFCIKKSNYSEIKEKKINALYAGILRYLKLKLLPFSITITFALIFTLKCGQK